MAVAQLGGAPSVLAAGSAASGSAAAAGASAGASAGDDDVGSVCVGSVCVDVTIGNVDAIAKTAFVGAIAACDARIAPLIRAVKCWARSVGAQGDDPSDGVNR